VHFSLVPDLKDFSSKLLEEAPASEISSESDDVGSGHIVNIPLCNAAVRYREESSRLHTAAETVEIGHLLPFKKPDSEFSSAIAIQCGASSTGVIPTLADFSLEEG
jgi:hypothetical protein